MKNAAIVAIIAVVVIAASVAIYGAVAKSTSEEVIGGETRETGGVGQILLSGACKALGLKC